MRVMSAKDAKNRFGELLLEAQKEAVTIERNGKPVAVVLSWEAHEQVEQLKLERLRAMIAEADADIDGGRLIEMGTAGEHEQFFEDLLNSLEHGTETERAGIATPSTALHGHREV